MILNENPNGVLLFQDEIAGFLATMERDGHENDRAFYLEAWNGYSRYTYDRPYSTRDARSRGCVRVNPRRDNTGTAQRTFAGDVLRNPGRRLDSTLSGKRLCGRTGGVAEHRSLARHRCQQSG